MNSDDHARRSRSFGAVAAQYAEHRPGYPADAVRWALEPVGRDTSELLDLGAGTGKLTESLLDLPDSRVTAVEPDLAMLAELRTRYPGARAFAGSAESIPLPDASVDAVLVGQAWHWFDPERAQTEIARVLRHGGVLAALWNGDDDSVEWVAGYSEAASLGRPVANFPAAGATPTFPAHPMFAPGEHTRFAHRVPTTSEGMVDTLATHSWALLSDPADREAAFDRIRAYLATRPETASGEFELPLVTDVLRTLRR